jgi:hypothetical protein
VFLPLFATLALLGQAPAAPSAPAEPTGPLSVLFAPPEAAGVPSHIVSFAQAHVYEQLKQQGLRVVSTAELSQRLPASQRKTILGCNRTQAWCLSLLGEVANTEVVLTLELVQFVSGYRVGLKAFKTRDGSKLSEQFRSNVKETEILDALTDAGKQVMDQALQQLRPAASAPVVEAPRKPEKDEKGGQETKDTPAVEASARGGAPGWAWVPAAGGAVLAAAGTYFYLEAGERHRQLTKPGEPGSVRNGRELAEDGKRMQTLSAISYAAGAAGVLTTGLLYLLSDKKAAVQPTVSMGPGGTMLGVAGTLP